jgi:hypothetical protein
MGPADTGQEIGSRVKDNKALFNASRFKSDSRDTRYLVVTFQKSTLFKSS